MDFEFLIGLQNCLGQGLCINLLFKTISAPSTTFCLKTGKCFFERQELQIKTHFFLPKSLCLRVSETLLL